MSSGGRLNNDPCKSRCSLCWQVDVLCVMSSWKITGEMCRFLPVEALRSKIDLIDQQHQILPVDTNKQEIQLNKVTMQKTNAGSNGVIIAWKLWLKQMQGKDKKIGFLKKLNERWDRQYLEKAYLSNQNIRDKTTRFKDERNKELELRL